MRCLCAVLLEYHSSTIGTDTIARSTSDSDTSIIHLHHPGVPFPSSHLVPQLHTQPSCGLEGLLEEHRSQRCIQALPHSLQQHRTAQGQHSGQLCVGCGLQAAGAATGYKCECECESRLSPTLSSSTGGWATRAQAVQACAHKLYPGDGCGEQRRVCGWRRRWVSVHIS